MENSYPKGAAEIGVLELTRLLSNPFLRNLSVVFSESIATKLLNFMIILLLSRMLGPGDYGKYSYIFVTVAFCSAFFDFGMENTAVRFSAKDKENTNAIFGLYLSMKLLLVAIVVAVLAVFGGEIFTRLDKAEIVKYLPFLIVGFIGESMLFVNDTYLQAVQRFKLRALINVSRYFVAFAFIGALYLNDGLILEYVCYLFVLPCLLSALFFTKYFKFIKCYVSEKLGSEKTKQILNYEKWMFLVSVPNNTLGRIDFFMIAFWVSYDQIGIYNAAFQLSSIVTFIPFAYGKVMLPKLAEMTEQTVFRYTNKIMKKTLLLSAAMLLLIPLSGPVITILLGSDYAAAIPVLEVMLVSAVIAFVLVPVEYAIYSIGKPMFITVGKYVQIATIVLAIMITVPQFGVIWAAISVAFARLVYGIILMMLYSGYRRKFTAVAEIVN